MGVSFRTKAGKTHTVAPVEFLRRFIQHVLPDGFKKIRHYGLYASGGDDKLGLARTRLTPVATPAETTLPSASTWQQLLRELTERDVDRCSRCDGSIQRIAIERQVARGPPVTEAA